MPGVLSATLGIWVGVGSRDESPAVAGSSHFLEHLLFKGTATRSALEIATAMDAVGGEMNAFTAKEHTCYYANVLASDLPLAVDLLSDLVTEALNTAADLESERTVVLEEIAMRDDEPSDAVHDLFSETLFGDTPLGRSVLGTVESIEGLTRDDVDGWYRGAVHDAVDRGHRRGPGRPPAGPRPGHGGLRGPAAGDGRPAPLRTGDGGIDSPARPGRADRPADRADPPAAGHPGLGAARRAPVRRGRPGRRRRRRHELAAVPGDPREARAWSTASDRRSRTTPAPARSRCTPAAPRSGSPRSCG